ncbi:hypothetical protein MBLNU457_g0857t1 [Dothideomycetes sp. NU457]
MAQPNSGFGWAVPVSTTRPQQSTQYSQAQQHGMPSTVHPQALVNQPLSFDRLLPQHPWTPRSMTQHHLTQQPRCDIDSYQQPTSFEMDNMLAPYHLSIEQDSWNPIRGNQPTTYGSYRADFQANIRPCHSSDGRNLCIAPINTSSDSGYVSRPDDTLSTQSAPVGTQSHVSTPQRPSKRPRNSSRSSNPVGPLGICLVCKQQGKDFPFKNDSDRTKHMKTHEKPMKCCEDGCGLEPYGCAISNDLERHKATKHGIYTPTWVFYKCRISDCSKADEIHDRKDNFRDHLRRVHVRSTKTKEEARIQKEDLPYWVNRSVYKATSAEKQALREGKLSSNRQRRPRGSASHAGSTMYDGSSVGQGAGYELESYAAPQEQTSQWMEPSYESNYADDNFGGFPVFSQNLEGLDFAAGSSLGAGLGLAAGPSLGVGLDFETQMLYSQAWDYSANEALGGASEEPQPQPDNQFSQSFNL